MGCCGGKSNVEELYSHDSDQTSSAGSSVRASTGSMDRDSVRLHKKKARGSQSKGSQRMSTDNVRKSVGNRKSVGLPGSPEESNRRSSADASKPGKGGSTADCPHSLSVSSAVVAPFSTVEINWKIRGVKCSQADWIGMYKGEEAPVDINDCVSTMMSTGKANGTVNFTAPMSTGPHHFRYFLLDDSFVCSSPVIMVSKLDKADVQADIFVRDAVYAEEEVARVDWDEQVEEPPEEPSAPTSEKKAPRQEKKVLTDMTGFESSKNPEASEGGEKTDPVSRWKKAAAAASTMEEAATSYFKVALTKKEMRAQEAQKKQQGGVVPKVINAPEDGTVGAAQGKENPATTPAAKEEKKGGWFKAREAKKGGWFQQGRKNEDPNSIKNRKAAASKAAAKSAQMEDIGGFSLDRGKKR